MLTFAAVLEKWEVPPINEVNRKLEKIERAIKRHDEAIEDMRLEGTAYATIQFLFFSLTL